jgi:hypothetical protein
MTQVETATRKTTSTEQEILEYLNDLRNSGATNMFGALPYLTAEFPNETKQECKRCLMLWMNNFNEEGDYESVKS